ncbi:MAG: hypothetical protein M0Z66_03855 [Thermaerobacter sp.]|nr:hypothetical protein [Thermaerobacter sp.]
MDEIVYAGISAGDGVRWWRYAQGCLQPLALAPRERPESIAIAILCDFAAFEPNALRLEDASALAQDFADQFLVSSYGVQANFVEAHRIWTWLAVLRMCGRA